MAAIFQGGGSEAVQGANPSHFRVWNFVNFDSINNKELSLSSTCKVAMFTPFVLNFLVRNLLQCVELNPTQLANQINYHKNISIERCLEVGQKHQFAPDVTRNFTFMQYSRKNFPSIFTISSSTTFHIAGYGYTQGISFCDHSYSYWSCN